MKTTLSMLVAASTLLTACGGGGSTSHPTGPTGLTITSANQGAVARATVAGALSVSNIQTATPGFGTVQASSDSGRAHALSAIVQRALAAVIRPRATIQGVSAHPAALTSDTSPCTVSGTLTTTFDDRDGNLVLSAGDVTSIEFNACRDSATSLFNGKAVVTLTTTPDATQIAASADFQDVTSVEGGLTTGINGSLLVAETDSDVDSDTTLTVGNVALTVTLASANYNDVVTLASGLRVRVDEQSAASRSSLTFDGMLQAHSVTGGAVTLVTLAPLIKLDADAYPSSGVLRAKGADGTLLITVLNATTVQVQLDTNDDGVYEGSTTLAWNALMPS
ncbi:MAG: hypothetical protein ABIR54_16520 [Burkholderiaceae bacterium]